MPHRKELQFFNDYWPRGLDWYREHFKYAPDGALIGEATPTYLTSPDVPERLAQVVPNAKLITLCRNPVDRAYSGYWFRIGYRLEPRSFEEAVRAELAGDPTAFPYLDHGRYARHLERFERSFPRDRLFVALLDDLHEDPRAVYSDICRFLGVDPGSIPEEVGQATHQAHRLRSMRLRRMTLKWQARLKLPPRIKDLLYELNKEYVKYPPMSGELREMLVARFSEDNARLAERLDRDLSAWAK